MATANVGPSFQGCPFQAPDQKWQARFFCYVASLALAHSSAAPFLPLHDMVLAWFTREAVRRLQRASICGKVLPDNTGVCDSEGKLIWPGMNRECIQLLKIYRHSYVLAVASNSWELQSWCFPLFVRLNVCESEHTKDINYWLHKIQAELLGQKCF